MYRSLCRYIKFFGEHIVVNFCASTEAASEFAPLPCAHESESRPLLYVSFADAQGSVVNIHDAFEDMQGFLVHI